MLEVEVLHAARGDKKKSIDTTTEKGRQEAAVFLNKLMKQGTAVFLERGKKTYRVTKYDPNKDLLTVVLDDEGKKTTAKGKKSKTVACAPVAGGC